MNFTPASLPNLMYWGLLPMSVSNYGGDIQVCTLPDYLGGPIQFGLNPMGSAYLNTCAFSGIGGGWGCNTSPQIDFGAVNYLAQAFSAGQNQNFTAQQYAQSGQAAAALKNTLNSLLLNSNATSEDRDNINKYLEQIDKYEAELKGLQGQNLSVQEVYDKTAAIEKELRKIATQTGEINSKVGKATADNAQASKTQTSEESQGVASVSVSTQKSSTSTADNNCELKSGLFKGRLAGHEATVVKICKKYGVSPALVASIIGLESGWGTSNLAQHNNFGGYRAAGDLGKNAKGFGYFSTVEKGLEAMIKNLASYDERYSEVKAVDFNNLDAIAKHYCSPVWAGRVRNMYNSRVKKYVA